MRGGHAMRDGVSARRKASDGHRPWVAEALLVALLVALVLILVLAAPAAQAAGMGV